MIGNDQEKTGSAVSRLDSVLKTAWKLNGCRVLSLERGGNFKKWGNLNSREFRFQNVCFWQTYCSAWVEEPGRIFRERQLEFRGHCANFMRFPSLDLASSPPKPPKPTHRRSPVRLWSTQSRWRCPSRRRGVVWYLADKKVPSRRLGTACY